MKFNYPYRLYLFGLSLFLLFSLMGMILLMQIENVHFFLIIVYLVYVVKMSRWYYKKFVLYKRKKVLVNSYGLIIFDEDEEVLITRSEIDMIVEFDHQQRLKIHHVLQIFTKDERSFILTSEINQFKELKKYLSAEYDDVYYIIKDTVRGTADLRKKLKLKV